MSDTRDVRSFWAEDRFSSVERRYYDQDRIARVREHLLEDRLDDLSPMDVLELVCDWLNMDAGLERLESAAREPNHPGFWLS